MSDDPLFVGACWCGGPWLAAAFRRDAFDHADVFAELGDLWFRYEDAGERILVDVPIGLLEGGADERPCDERARAVLGERAQTVRSPPVREATRKRRYPAAARVHERTAGTSLSRAAFERSEGIAAVDELLQELTEARPVFAESHPEVCFRAFAGDPLDHPKRTAAGYAERMRILAEYDRDAPPTVQSTAEATGGHDVAVHDVLDAVALGYTARPGPDPLRSLPDDYDTDPTGLPMRMCYRAADPLE